MRYNPMALCKTRYFHRPLAVFQGIRCFRRNHNAN